MYKDASQISFDFDYRDEEEELSNAGSQTEYNETEGEIPEALQFKDPRLNKPGYSSYFGFGVDVPLDSEGDFILPDEKLDEVTIHNGLSTVGRIVNSFKHAYLHFKATNKRLNDIDMLSQYVHLRNIDLSHNRLKDLQGIEPIPYLQVLNVEGNMLSDVTQLPNWKYLQALSLSRNGINRTQGFQPNLLAFLNLSKNRLSTLEDFRADVFPNLLVLELRDNILYTLDGISLPKLENLYIANNQLQNLSGIENCPNLKIIHARQNNISELADFSVLPNVEYLNLRANKIYRFTEVKRLSDARKLKDLVLAENRIAGEERYRDEVEAACPPSLRRLDKFLYTQIEQADAIGLRQAREEHYTEEVIDTFYPPDRRSSSKMKTSAGSNYAQLQPPNSDTDY